MLEWLSGCSRDPISEPIVPCSEESSDVGCLLESFRKLAQFTPHFRMASFAVLLSACLSPARDFSVDRKEFGDGEVLLLALVLLGVEVVSGERAEESIDFDFPCSRCEFWVELRCADCGERCISVYGSSRSSPGVMGSDVPVV
jgi:hypothetical protein